MKVNRRDITGSAEDRRNSILAACNKFISKLL